jgi:hypothetical protein
METFQNNQKQLNLSKSSDNYHLRAMNQKSEMKKKDEGIIRVDKMSKNKNDNFI